SDLQLAAALESFGADKFPLDSAAAEAAAAAAAAAAAEAAATTVTDSGATSPPTLPEPEVADPVAAEVQSSGGTSSLGNTLYSVFGSLLAGAMMFTILFDPVRKNFIYLIDTIFGTATGTRKRRDAVDQGLSLHISTAFDAFTAMQDKIEAMNNLVNS
ncbi:unnamed protein product, partial [Meganyctiphanes norvegica]